MRIVLQRVSKAQVTVAGEITGKIGKGYALLIGFEPDDDIEDMEWSIKKLKTLRLFEDEEGKMNLNIDEVKGEILAISQFTLHAKIKKGTRPSFARAAKPDVAQEMYDEYVERLSHTFKHVASGIFGAEMNVDLINDGPVTLFIDTKNRE